VLATVFSIAWYNVVMQRSLVIYHGISHLSLVFSWYTAQKHYITSIYSWLKICISSQRELIIRYIYNQEEEGHLCKEGLFLFLYLFPQITNVSAR